MANIVLKNIDDTVTTYSDIETLTVDTEDGGTQVFSAGEAVDDVEIFLDFKNGDQSVSATEGFLVKSAIIRKPDELIPENIAKGITIAGIEGDYEGEAIENIEITLDFRNGDQTVDAQGKLVKSATILKPADLLPENIVKDKEIAGIRGIYEVAPTETESLTITENGTYTAPEGKSYSPIIVDVPETEIEPLTITENGTYTAPDGKAYSPIIVNVPSSGVTEIDIFEDTLSDFQEDTGLFVGTYFKYSEPPFEIKEGETYYVEWEGETFTCKGVAVSVNLTDAVINAVYLGNGFMLGYPHNNEPFAVVYLVDAGLTEFITFADGSYKVRVYQKSGSDNSGGGNSGGLLPNIELKEILTERTLTFAVGNSTYIPNTPAVVLADKTAVANMDVINDGEGGLVVWDGKVYPVYAGSRRTSNVQFGSSITTFAIKGAIGNVGIPSTWNVYGFDCPVIADTQSCGASEEPFLIVANTYDGLYVGIPENSTELTHTLQMYKLIQTVYVTFMNGETELLKHPVIIDKNCEDVIATGVLAEPTREMTVDKVFTFSGWSLTEGGAVNSGALTNITRDKTVYAVFDEAPRKYTARFYDGDNVLSEQEVEYGKQATPPSTDKDGHQFIGWTPSDLTITRDTDFYGTWETKREFTNQALPSGITGAYKAKYSPDGTRLFFVYSNKIYMYDTTTQPYTLLTSVSISSMADMEISPDGKYIAFTHTSNQSVSLSNLVYIYSIGASSLTRMSSVIPTTAKATSSGYCWSCSFSADSSKLIVSHSSGSFFVFNVSTASTWTYTSAQLASAVKLTHLQFSPDSTKVVGLKEMTSTSQSIYIYDATNSYAEVTSSYLTLKTGRVTDRLGDNVAYSPDGRYLAMCFSATKYYTATNSCLVVYDTTTTPYTVVKQVTVTSSSIAARGAAFNADGSLLAVCTDKSPYIEVYNTNTWELIEAPKTLPTVASMCCAFSANNHLFVGGDSASTLYKI